jgi:hypothetical protein
MYKTMLDKTKKSVVQGMVLNCQAGLVRKYDETPFQRETHDQRIAKIREDKTLTSEQRVDAFKEEYESFAKY